MVCYYKVRQVLLQSATSITNCDDYNYKVRQNSVQDQRMESQHFTHTDITEGCRLNRSSWLYAETKTRPMQGNPRQSWILRHTIVDSGFLKLSVELEFQILKK